MDTVTYVELNGVRGAAAGRVSRRFTLFPEGRSRRMANAAGRNPADPQLRGEVLYKRFKEFGHRRVSRKTEAFVK